VVTIFTNAESIIFLAAVPKSKIFSDVPGLKAGLKSIPMAKEKRRDM